MDSSFYDSSQHHHQSFQSSNEDENKLQDDEAEPEDLTKGTLLKYEPTMVEIQEHEYHPPKPYYVVSIGAHFHHQVKHSFNQIKLSFDLFYLSNITGA